jgi:DNA-binding beta-propeller fold protein YncE
VNRLLCLVLAFAVWNIPNLLKAQERHPDAPPINLPSSKMLTTPTPGRVGATNSFPATIAISPDGRYAALLNDGYGTQESMATQSIAVLDLKTNQLTDYPDKRLSEEERTHQSYFLGLVFSSDGKHLYASVGSITDPTGEKPGDTGNGIAVYSFTNGKVAPERFIAIAPQALATGKKVAIALRKTPPGTAIPYPAGLALVSAGGHDRLLVANNLSDNVVLLDVATSKVLQRFDLSTANLVPSSFPYTCIATRDGRRAWCSLWNASRVAELDLASGKIIEWIRLREPDDPIAPGSHPTALLLSPDEGMLYVALSNGDAVAVVATARRNDDVYLSTIAPAQKYPGGYPTALAQSSDGRYLFAANSSLDAVAVFDISQPNSSGSNVPRSPIGFIPTDWYPSALAVEGNDLLIATAKGQGTRPNKESGKTPWEIRHHEHPYIPTLLRGSIARLNIPSTLGKLDELTRVVEHDNLLQDDPGKIQFASGTNPIKHVIYVIKENRTYDQILGDLKPGDGDPSLTMYGADITPNEHKLAMQFGVLDNFYDSGEVSGDGHLWSTAAITSDYNEKTWQIAYRGKERTYDFQGTVADEYPLDHNQPDIDDPGTGYLWDNVAHHGLTYRDYGEYVNAVWCNKPRKAATPKQGTPSAQESTCPRTELHQGDALEPNVGDPHAGPSPFPWTVPLFKGVKPTKAVLRDHFDPLFPDFNTDYPDQLRADEFLNEFAAYTRAREANEGPEFQLPAFVLLYLPDDHTGGTRPGRPRPEASVADNDLAVGRVVDAVSHSPYWEDTAIFILEDDAQDGGDHVDAHRSIAFVVSKYSPGTATEPYVDHRFYTTVNMIHTMEMLLGLPPMNQNDAYAPAMGPMFSGAGTQPAFKADYRNLKNGLIYETNKRDAKGASESAKMDFSRPDAAGAAKLNQVLWRDQKGDVPMPAPRHAVFPARGD